jgi:hypothetical protein
MTFADGLGIGDGRETGTTAVTQDTFREEAIRVLTEVSLEYPI